MIMAISETLGWGGVAGGGGGIKSAYNDNVAVK